MPKGKPELLSDMSDARKDKYILSLEKRIADLEGKLASIAPDDVYRASWLNEQLTEKMKPFSQLRNGVTLIDMVQKSLDDMAYVMGEVRHIKKMLGVAIDEEQEEQTDEALMRSLMEAGMADEEIAEILLRRKNGQH